MLQEDASGKEEEKADFQEAKQKAGRSNRKLLPKCRGKPRAMTIRLEKVGAGAESARLNYHHST